MPEISSDMSRCSSTVCRNRQRPEYWNNNNPMARVESFFRDRFNEEKYCSIALLGRLSLICQGKNVRQHNRKWARDLTWALLPLDWMLNGTARFCYRRELKLLHSFQKRELGQDGEELIFTAHCFIAPPGERPCRLKSVISSAIEKKARWMQSYIIISQAQVTKK